MSHTFYTVSHWRMGRDYPDHYTVVNKEAFEALALPGQKGTSDQQIADGLNFGYIKWRIPSKKWVTK